MSDWATPHVTQAVIKHESTLYGNGQKGLTTRVELIEGDVEEIKEDLKHLVKWNHYIMAALAIATFIAQFFVIPMLLSLLEK